MYVELFVVAGQSVELENSLKKVVEDLRGQVQRPDKVRLATVKIRPDAVDQVLRLVGEPPEKVPPHYRSLVNMLKKYGISKFPAVVVDGVKVGEGDVNLEEVLRAVQARAKAEFPELAALELVPPKPTPAPIQPVISQPPPPLRLLRPRLRLLFRRRLRCGRLSLLLLSRSRFSSLGLRRRPRRLRHRHLRLRLLRRLGRLRRWLSWCWGGLTTAASVRILAL